MRTIEPLISEKSVFIGIIKLYYNDLLRYRLVMDSTNISSHIEFTDLFSIEVVETCHWLGTRSLPEIEYRN